VPERPPKRRGRPPLDPDNPSVTLNVRMPARQLDELYRRAYQMRGSVPQLVRGVLNSWLRRRPDEI
jgi:hypothetical protein